MASKPRRPTLATRCSMETKARFLALATSRSTTVDSLLGQLVVAVIDHNPVTAAPSAASEKDGATSRMSIRLRGGDRELLNVRAAKRGMKAASYATMLVHSHVRGRAPLPKAELDRLKVAVGELSAVGRNLNQLVRAVHAGQVVDVAPEAVLTAVHGQVAQLREHVATLVRVNLESWEAGDA